MSDILLESRDGDIVTLTINRPDKLNAMTKGLWGELGERVRAADADRSVRCLMLRGAGAKAFSPGNDIAEFETDRSNAAQAREYGKLMHGTLSALREATVPTVALIRGICVGGGLEIAGLCDLRICGASSRFGAPIKNLGLVMAHAEMAALIGLVGKAKALEILLEGRIFGAEEALAKGLVTRVVADDQVEPEAYAAARRIAEGAPLVARWHKKFAAQIASGAKLTPAQLDEGFLCFDTEDFRIGYRAFLDKKKPEFRGR
jgi:enoyl-CoA hydratase